MVKPILVFGYVNPSRGDDALDSELLDFLQKHTVIRLDLNNQRVTQLGILYSDWYQVFICEVRSSDLIIEVGESHLK